MNRTPLSLAATVVALVTICSVAVQAETFAAADFLANYVNPEQAKVPAEGIYPHGQRMLFGAYAGSKRQMERMAAAGFSTDGPHYHGTGNWMMKYWDEAGKLGLKNWYRLRDVGASGWGGVGKLMQTPEGQATITKHVTRMINSVQDNPRLNDNIFAWYGYEEEMIYRDNFLSLAEQRAYTKFVYEIIKRIDRRKRPFYVSERGDSDQTNMAGNASIQDGVLKQNYLMRANGYDYKSKDLEQRYLMHQWALDQLKTARDADKTCPSYTGKKRAAISTLSAYIDPDDSTYRTEEWLRTFITHDVYTQLAAGIHGFNMFTWSRSSKVSQKTKIMQENLYMEVLGLIAKSGLGEVFLWGDDREDIALQIAQGPKTIQWTKYDETYTVPSIQFRNIQYGANRYVLLVNSSKQVITVKLSGFPSGMRMLDMIPDKWADFSAGITSTIQPLGVRMCKLSASATR